MKHLFILLFVSFFVSLAFGQGTYTYKPVKLNLTLQPDTALSNRLSILPGFSQLNDFERGFLYCINYARRHPADFNKQAVVPYLEAYPKLKIKYGESLSGELSSLAPMGAFTLDLRLLLVARAHAADLANHDLMSHTSSSGATTQQRFEKAGVGCGSECINMGNDNTPLEVLLSLLIDYNVPELGHRKALLNPKLTSMGVGEAQSPKTGLHYTVADLACM